MLSDLIFSHSSNLFQVNSEIIIDRTKIYNLKFLLHRDGKSRMVEKSLKGWGFSHSFGCEVSAPRD